MMRRDTGAPNADLTHSVERAIRSGRKIIDGLTEAVAFAQGNAAGAIVREVMTILPDYAPGIVPSGFPLQHVPDPYVLRTDGPADQPFTAYFWLGAGAEPSVEERVADALGGVWP
jgi:hypothetical protein